jgi:hypothetical protein
MSTPQEPVDDNAGDRITDLEDRVAELEEELRLRALEDRLGDLESGASDDADLAQEQEGQRAMRLAIAQFLNSGNIGQAVSELLKPLVDAIKDWKDVKTKELQNQKAVSLWMYFSGLGFSAFLLLDLTFLLWRDKITKELAAGLLGSLIGYWYGRDKSKG